MILGATTKPETDYTIDERIAGWRWGHRAGHTHDFAQEIDITYSGLVYDISASSSNDKPSLQVEVLVPVELSTFCNRHISVKFNGPVYQYAASAGVETPADIEAPPWERDDIREVLEDRGYGMIYNLNFINIHGYKRVERAGPQKLQKCRKLAPPAFSMHQHVNFTYNCAVHIYEGPTAMQVSASAIYHSYVAAFLWRPDPYFRYKIYYAGPEDPNAECIDERNKWWQDPGKPESFWTQFPCAPERSNQENTVREKPVRESTVQQSSTWSGKYTRKRGMYVPLLEH